MRRDQAGKGDLAGQSWAGEKNKTKKQAFVLSANTVGQGLRLELDPTLLRKPRFVSVPCRGRRDRKKREGKETGMYTSFHTGFTLFLMTLVLFFTPVGDKEDKRLLITLGHPPCPAHLHTGPPTLPGSPVETFLWIQFTKPA